MTKTLQRSLAHLGATRRLIAGHSAAAAVVGLLPIPYVEDQVPALIRRAMIRRIAEARHVDLDEEAVRAVAEGRVAKPNWRSLLGVGSLVRTARRSVRTALLAYGIYRRSEAASRTFALGTLFDHYCARHHVGVGLDAAQAFVLRERIDAAIASKGGSLGAYALRRAFTAGLRAAVRAPFEIASALTFGRIKRLRAKDEVEAEELVETTIDSELAGQGSFLARVVNAADRQLSSMGNGWIDGLVGAFEEPR